jgi:hypothetical protein
MNTALLLLLSLPLSLLAELESIRNEPDLEKRSALALAYADTALDRAREAYQNDDEAALSAALAEVGQSMDLCKSSLDESGKNARKRPKYFKRAEIGIRRLIRRLDNFRIEMSPDDRTPVEKLVERAHRLQEDILHAIMGKKK